MDKKIFLKSKIIRQTFKKINILGLPEGRKAKILTTAQAVAFFDLRSNSEGGSEGWTTYLYCPCYGV
jgi:hypothetical protein